MRIKIIKAIATVTFDVPMNTLSPMRIDETCRMLEDLCAREDIIGLCLMIDEQYANSGNSKDAHTSGVSADTPARCAQILSRCAFPLACVISGVYSGADMLCCLACHFRFADLSAVLSFANFAGPSLALARELADRHAPAHAAIIHDHISNNRVVSAHQAAAEGLVLCTKNRAESESCAVDFLARITAGRKPLLIRTVMRSLLNSRDLPYEKALETECGLFCDIAENVSALQGTLS